MRTRLFLIGIVLLAFFLRFYALATNPPGLTWDEVAWGYNSYALGIDGKDEFGRFIPLDYLESFGDFKPPVYAYLGILPVKLFGLNAFATRFPSAFFGTVTVVITYLLVKELLWKKKQTEKEAAYTAAIGLVTALLLAISPWHVLLSRAAFEANVATFFIVTGVWLFLYAVHKKPWLLVVSAISFVLSMHTFNTARIVAPLLVTVLAVGFWRELWAMKKHVLIAAVVGCALLSPAVPFLLSPQAKLRYHEVNIFSDITVIERVNGQVERDNNALWSKVIHNRRLTYGVEFLRHYFDNLTPSFLFIKGDGNPKFSTQDVGQLYFWELPFLLAGVLFLFRKREGHWWIIPLWLLLGILPAATARETPHALRIASTLPTFQIIVAYGIVTLFSYRKRYRSIAIGILLVIALFHMTYFLHGYFTHYPKEFSGEWQYGYKEALQYIQENKTKYERVYFTEALGRPYAYALFYTKYSPKQFRKEALVEREAMGFVHVSFFDKYYFAKELHTLPEGENILFVDVPTNIPSGVNVLKNFTLLNGDVALIAYTK